MGSLATTQEPQRVLLVTYPRTASNLLLKMLCLNDQPKVASNDIGGYYFREAFLHSLMTGKAYKSTSDLSVEEAQVLQQTFQHCCQQMQRDSQAALDQGKSFFVKEHALWLMNPVDVANVLDQESNHLPTAFRVQPQGEMPGSFTWSDGNRTVVPDQVLRQWRVLFLIRHPALAFPSYYRAMLELRDQEYLHDSEFQPHLQANTTLQWTRSIYDLCSSEGCKPFLLDADDVISNQAAVFKLCEVAGLDPSCVRFSWSKKPNGITGGDKSSSSDTGSEFRKSLGEVMEKTLGASSGVDKGKSSENIDMQAEKNKWKGEFGQDVADMLEKHVNEALPDYEYLRSKRSA